MNGGKRHPVRGFFAGLFLGISIALFLIMAAVVALGDIVPIIVVVVFAVLGVVWALYGPSRGRGGTTKSETVSAGAGPAPGAGEPPK